MILEISDIWGCRNVHAFCGTGPCYQTVGAGNEGFCDINQTAMHVILAGMCVAGPYQRAIVTLNIRQLVQVMRVFVA